MHKRSTLIALATIVFALAAAPATANGGGDDDDGGGSSAASLTGETFLTSELPFNPGSLEVDGTCDPLGTSTFTFSATGVAFGPYPGTFTESGTVTIESPIGLATFEATFTIDSPAGTVNGRKLREVPAPLGLCGSAAFPTVPPASTMRFEGNVDYTATIVTPSGTSTDSGTSFVNMGDAQVRGVADFNGFIFSENFTSTATGTCEGGGDDGDDDDDDDCGEDDDEAGGD